MPFAVVGEGVTVPVTVVVIVGDKVVMGGGVTEVCEVTVGVGVAPEFSLPKGLFLKRK